MYKVGESVAVKYRAVKLATGLVDLTLTPFNPAGGSGSPVVFTEVGNGIYASSFTPDVVGQWYIEVKSATNGDNIAKVFDVVAVTTQDVYDKEITMDGKVDSIVSSQAVIEGKVDGVAASQTNIEAKIDSIDSRIFPGGYFM